MQGGTKPSCGAKKVVAMLRTLFGVALPPFCSKAETGVFGAATRLP